MDRQLRAFYFRGMKFDTFFNKNMKRIGKMGLTLCSLVLVFLSHVFIFKRVIPLNSPSCSFSRKKKRFFFFFTYYFSTLASDCQVAFSIQLFYLFYLIVELYKK